MIIIKTYKHLKRKNELEEVNCVIIPAWEFFFMLPMEVSFFFSSLYSTNGTTHLKCGVLIEENQGNWIHKKIHGQWYTLFFFIFTYFTILSFLSFLKKTTTKAHGPLPSALPLLRFARCMKHLQSIARDACRRRWGFLAKTALELLVAKHRPNVDGHLDATVFRRSCHGSVFNGNNYNSHMSQIVTTKEAINTRSPSTK